FPARVRDDDQRRGDARAARGRPSAHAGPADLRARAGHVQLAVRCESEHDDHRADRGRLLLRESSFTGSAHVDRVRLTPCSPRKEAARIEETGMNRSKVLKLQRRTVLKALSAACAIGMGPLAHARSDRFVFGTTGGKFHEGTKKVFIEDTGFRVKNKLDVVYDIQNDSGIAAKVLASCGRPTYDIAQAVESNAARAHVSGCLLDYDASIVTNLADIPPAYRVGGYYASAVSLLNGLVFNTKHVSKPSTWEDMLNPRYKGKIGIPAFGWIGQHFLHAVNKAFGGDEDNIDPGVEVVAEMVRKNEAIVVSGSN